MGEREAAGPEGLVRAAPVCGSLEERPAEAKAVGAGPEEEQGPASAEAAGVVVSVDPVGVAERVAAEPGAGLAAGPKVRRPGNG